MKDLNIVDVEMNNGILHDESEVLVTLDSGGLSGSSTPPLHSNESSTKNSDKQNAFNNNSTSSSDDVNSHSKFPPPPLVSMPVICNVENRGEKEKSNLPLQNGLTHSNGTNLCSDDKSHSVKISSQILKCVDEINAFTTIYYIIGPA